MNNAVVKQETKCDSKRVYQSPVVNQVVIDHEISLVMMSGEVIPPVSPIGSLTVKKMITLG